MGAKVYEFPDDCHYTESDEWVRVEGRAARIGITDYAQSELSDIVFVELPEIGSRVEIGDPLGVVESVKAVSDLLAPIGGEVTHVNEDLEEHPEWVNEEPYERGWLVESRVADPSAIDDLMTADNYLAHVEERAA